MTGFSEFETALLVSYIAAGEHMIKKHQEAGMTDVWRIQMVNNAKLELEKREASKNVISM
jgi:hypothetical protein